MERLVRDSPPAESLKNSIVSLSKTLYLLLSTGSNQEDRRRVPCLSDRVLDSRLRGGRFEALHCVLEQNTLSSA